MKKYAVHQSEYLDEDADFYTAKVKDLRTLLIELLDYNDDGETLEELKKEFDSCNDDGSGGPHITVYDEETNEKVLG